MTQRTVFTKEMIVETAFQLTRELGWSFVTARTIAQKLGSSTMPLYSALKSMDEIEKEVRARAEACMQGFQRGKYTDEVMLNSAVGYVVFARDEKNLFRFLYVDRPLAANRGGDQGQARDVQELGGVVDLADQAAVALKDPLVLKSWAFTHGLASLISGGVIDLPTDRIATLLTEVGSAIYYMDQLQKKTQEGGKE
jgi:AcrR family transcriptional regulator